TSEARIYIKATQPDDIVWIEDKIREITRKKFPKSQLAFLPPTSIFEKLFSSSEPPLVAEVSLVNNGGSFDIPSLLQLNRDINNNKALQSINKVPLQNNIIISVDLEKLLLYNVTYEELYKELKTSFKENYIGTLRSYQRYIPILISGNSQSITNIIAHSKVQSSDFNLVPINALVTISNGQDLKTITAGKNGEYIPFTFNPNSRQKETFTKEINTIVSKNKNYNVGYSGSLFTSSKMLRELGIVLIISVLLLYFILAAQFESLKQPFLVLLELPIDFAGALIFLYLLGESLNLMSAIGIIVMSGIIINDSILKLDVINQLRKEGYPLLDAIKIGGHRRLRAILMTSLTSILAMIPLLFSNDLGSELQKPFSYGLIGGMVIGTIVSLYLVPLAYWYIYRNEELRMKN
ncbi:MAG: efflux RND transporter permease subunit, partial [Bacteroidetes bacterium]|nr:efflux RND transporter permease subunit [Bacteroidota bacterium]